MRPICPKLGVLDEKVRPINELGKIVKEEID